MDIIIDKAQHDLIQVILANTSSAMEISKILCDHSEDKILKADEVICGLIYRLMIPMTDLEIKNSMDEASSIMNGSSDEDSSDEDIQQEIIDDSEDLTIHRKIRTNNCNCDICQGTRVCILNFNEYVPQDELGDKFKKSIIDTCLTYNKII